MYGMFSGCSGITSLDLKNFDTVNVTDMRYMFNNMTSLTRIYVSSIFDVSNVSSSDKMFNNDTFIQGGSGTVYDSNHIDKEYAHFDGGVDYPGYFYESSIPLKRIKFDSNEGSGFMSNQYVDFRNSVKIKTNKFTRKLYKFTGWNTKADGTGDSYVDQGTIPANTYNNNITLYAQWIRNGWEFENESTWTSSDPLTDQKWLFYDNGTRIMNGWIYVNGNYNYNEEGTKNYYYMKDGYLYMGWLQDNGNWYFLSWFDRNNNGYVEGLMFRDMDYTIDGINYHFDENGVCQSTPRLGWVFENESDFDSTGEPLQAQRWEYYEPTGQILSGWHELPAKNGSTTNHWFYFENGVAYLGWLEQEGNWYYLKLADDNNNGLVEGYMLQNITYNIDGVDYTFYSDGICQNPPSQTSNSTNNAPASVDEPVSSNESISEENDSSNSNNEVQEQPEDQSTNESNKEQKNTNNEEENEETNNVPDLSASIYGIFENEKNTKTKFILPKEAYNLRRYFMGVFN